MSYSLQGLRHPGAHPGARPCWLTRASGSLAAGASGEWAPSLGRWTSGCHPAPAERHGPDYTAWPGRSGQWAELLCGTQALPKKPREGFEQLLAGSIAGAVAAWQEHLGFCLCLSFPTAQVKGKPARHVRQHCPTRGAPGELRSNLHTSLLSSASSTLLAGKVCSMLVHEPPPDAGTRSSGVCCGLSCCGFTSISVHPNPLRWGWGFFCLQREPSHCFSPVCSFMNSNVKYCKTSILAFLQQLPSADVKAFHKPKSVKLQRPSLYLAL